MLKNHKTIKFVDDKHYYEDLSTYQLDNIPSSNNLKLSKNYLECSAKNYDEDHVYEELPNMSEKYNSNKKRKEKAVDEGCNKILEPSYKNIDELNLYPLSIQ